MSHARKLHDRGVMSRGIELVPRGSPCYDAFNSNRKDRQQQGASSHMANIKSAEKRAHQAVKRRTANRAVMSTIGTVRRKAMETVVKGADTAAVAKVVAEYASTLDKAAKRGIIKRNTADRRKARLAQRVAAAAK